MRRRFPIIVPVLILMAALFFGGNWLSRNAQRQDRNNTTPQGRNFIGQNLPGTIPDYSLNRVNPKGIRTTPGTGFNGTGQQIRQQTGFDRQKAESIRNQLGDIDGIRQINTIVNGNTAVIGYSPSGKTTNANTIRNMITDRVKQMDNTITNVIVGDSEDFSSRMRRLMDNINNSKPLKDLNNEYNQLIQNIRSGGL